MTSRRIFISTLFTLAAVPLLVSAQTSCTAKKETTATSSKLKAAGAIVIASDEKKTKIKIKCAKCGYMTDEMEIDTPTADKPYSLEWTCPKCGHKQTVTIEVAAACCDK